MNQDLDHDYRIQVYIRKEGETIADGDEFKTEHFETLEDLDEAITHFYQGVLASLEEEIDDDEDANN